MQREIKFRAWDAESEVMTYSDKHNKNDYLDAEYFFQQDDEGKIVCYWECSYDDKWGEPATSSGFLDNIMQYTGLKDKNGKGIYEGDIFVMNDKGILHIVEWHDTGFMGKQKGTLGSYVGLGFWNSDIEVIGNIYEDGGLFDSKTAKKD